MPVPHDPANRARLSYSWRDATYHLIVDPTPLVVVISGTISEGQSHSTIEDAKSAFWEMIVSSILTARAQQDPYAAWPGVEIAIVPDPISGTVHVAERARGMRIAWPLPTAEAALLTYFGRLRHLIPETSSATADLR